MVENTRTESRIEQIKFLKASGKFITVLFCLIMINKGSIKCNECYDNLNLASQLAHPKSG